MSNDLQPFEPNDPDTDDAWLPLCTPQDRLSYMAAKGACDAALATAKQADAAAMLAYAKVKIAFDGARAAALAAGDSLDASVTAANSTKNAISDTPDLPLPGVRADPALVAAQSDAVKAAVAAYAAANAAIVAAQACYAPALKALAKLSESVDPADPGSATPSAGIESVAAATRDLALAAAAATRDRAEDAFNAVRFAVWAKLAGEG